MAPEPSDTSSRQRVRRHRAHLREQGLRPIQIWVPDVRSPAFARAAHRQSRLVAASERAEEDQQFIDDVTAPWGDE